MLADRLRADLLAARKARDAVAVSVLRTAIAAVENAEAPPLDGTGPAPSVGLVDHARLELDDADVERILRAEVADREDTIARVRAGGRPDAADELADELEVLRRYLP